MADVTIPIVQGVETGVNTIGSAVSVTATDTGKLANDGTTRLFMTSTPGATITFVTPKTVGKSALAVADPTYVLGAAGRVEAGPFPQDIYGATLDITVSATIEAVGYR